MGGNGKHRWKISIYHRHRSSSNPKQEPQETPREFLCPISGSLMADPVVVSSGHTYERVSVEVCRNLMYSPQLEDGSKPDFSAVISNLAMKSTILRWCENSGTELPRAPDYSSIERIVRALLEEEKPETQVRVSERELLEGVADKPPLILSHAATEIGHRVNHFYSSSSEESVIVGVSPGTPLPLTTRPLCYSTSSSSSEIVENESLSQISYPNSSISEEEQQLISKLKSSEVSEQELGVVSLRKITRTTEEARASLCTPRLLLAIRSLLTSRYSTVQTNAVASLVNLSLEKSNKVKIVRSGLVPLLVDVLKGGFSESQEHAAGALFSLSLEDENKMAIGVLGALPPLMHALRSESERSRHDSALCLYHLTLIQSNRVKLVKVGAVPRLLSMVKSGDLASRVLLILCNLAVCPEGSSAMLDGNAVECLVGMLRENKLDSESSRENCVAALYALCHGSLRFKGLAKEAGAVEVLREIEEKGSERAREKVKRILQMMRGRADGNTLLEGENETVPDSGAMNWTRHRVGEGRNPYAAKSTNF